jgi:hypothetical protein
LSKVVDVVDPKRLLEITQDAPSPNVLVQNLLGVARSEAAPEGARRRARRSVDGVFAPAPNNPARSDPARSDPTSARGEKAPAKEAANPDATAADGSAALKSVARSATKIPPPPKSLPPTERRPSGSGDPCSGCTPYG